MKRIYKIFALGALVISASSCKKYLDINQNPNQATSATPELVLSNALTNTGAMLVTFNNYGSQTNGYFVNAGGFGGFGSNFNYGYSNNEGYITGPWNAAYDNLADYQYIIDQSATDATKIQFGAIANIMKAFDFHMLIDLYGNVPYTEAFKGASLLTPKYDDAATVYQTLIKNIDAAIAVLKANPTAATPLRTYDVVYRTTASREAQMIEWIRFAQTLKLRMLNRIQAVPSQSSFANTEYASIDANIGYITQDALLQPGYIVSEGKQNPYWNAYYATAAQALSGGGRQYIPSTYIFSFYSGSKLLDNGRGALSYRQFPSTPNGQLSGPNNTVAPSNYPAWYIGDNFGNTTGLLKGATAAVPLFQAAESYLLQAEAQLNGKITGSAQTSFENGIKASYTYLSKDAAGLTSADANAYLTTYKTSNPQSYLVNYSVATTNAQRLEAIVTQKYLANNFYNGAESWAEFRRTGYPAIANGSTSATQTFASPQSTSTRADRLPVRIPYPDTEAQLNSQNVPTGVGTFTTPIFWDIN